MLCYILLAALVALAALCYYLCVVRTGVPQRREGAVFVTGAGSGMGEQAVELLARQGWLVFAGCFTADESRKKYAKLHDVVVVPLDVTDAESVAAAVRTVDAELERRKPRASPGLVALVQCAGVGFVGPAEYFPLDLYRRQLEVNLIGYIACAQAFLPLIKRAVRHAGPTRRGRLLFTGTGGGVPSSCPPLLSAYMASKWGGEAFCQSLRLELQLAEQPIDCVMINPGFVKPTRLMTDGMRHLERTWTQMDPAARPTYKPFVDAFVRFSEQEAGTHPRFVAEAMAHALDVGVPRLRYKVGFDSNASPIVGLFPTTVREWLIRWSMFERFMDKQ